MNSAICNLHTQVAVWGGTDNAPIIFKVTVPVSTASSRLRWTSGDHSEKPVLPASVGGQYILAECWRLYQQGSCLLVRTETGDHSGGQYLDRILNLQINRWRKLASRMVRHRLWPSTLCVPCKHWRAYYSMLCLMELHMGALSRRWHPDMW